MTHASRQCTDLGIPIVDTIPPEEAHDLVIDAMFGFSFSGVPREPFRSLITAIARGSAPVVSVDIPSGDITNDVTTDAM